MRTALSNKDDPRDRLRRALRRFNPGPAAMQRIRSELPSVADQATLLEVTAEVNARIVQKHRPPSTNH